MAITCKLCGSEIANDQVRVKGGVICKGCRDTLPIGVRNSVSDFNIKQIQQIKKLARPNHAPRNIWRFCGELKVCMDSIILNGMEYKLKDLRSVKLNFHPKDLGKDPFTAMGYITLVVETKTPHFLIEEAFMSAMTKAQYVISGMNITYHFSSDLEQTIRCVQDTICAGQSVITAAKEEAERARRQERERREQERRAQQERARQEREKKDPQKPGQSSPLEAAMNLYGLKYPFTEKELKKAYRPIVMKVHPDHPELGGSAEKFKKYQEAYELLKKFAVKESK